MMKKNVGFTGEEIFNIQLVKETYIKFEKNEKYIITANISGLKSFVRVLNYLLEKKYSFIRLLDLQISEYYTNHPDCFFDRSSLPLEIEKISGQNLIISISKNSDELLKDCPRLRLTRKGINMLKYQLLNLINQSNEEKVTVILSDESNTEKQLLEIIKINIAPIRKY